MEISRGAATVLVVLAGCGAATHAPVALAVAPMMPRVTVVVRNGATLTSARTLLTAAHAGGLLDGFSTLATIDDDRSPEAPLELAVLDELGTTIVATTVVHPAAVADALTKREPNAEPLSGSQARMWHDDAHTIVLRGDAAYVVTGAVKSKREHAAFALVDNGWKIPCAQTGKDTCHVDDVHAEIDGHAVIDALSGARLRGVPLFDQLGTDLGTVTIVADLGAAHGASPSWNVAVHPRQTTLAARMLAGVASAGPNKTPAILSPFTFITKVSPDDAALLISTMAGAFHATTSDTGPSDPVALAKQLDGALALGPLGLIAGVTSADNATALLTTATQQFGRDHVVRATSHAVAIATWEHFVDDGAGFTVQPGFTLPINVVPPQPAITLAADDNPDVPMSSADLGARQNAMVAIHQLTTFDEALHQLIDADNIARIIGAGSFTVGIITNQHAKGSVVPLAAPQAPPSPATLDALLAKREQYAAVARSGIAEVSTVRAHTVAAHDQHHAAPKR